VLAQNEDAEALQVHAHALYAAWTKSTGNLICCTRGWHIRDVVRFDQPQAFSYKRHHKRSVLSCLWLSFVTSFLPRMTRAIQSAEFS